MNITKKQKLLWNCNLRTSLFKKKTKNKKTIHGMLQCFNI